jgi:hypothetical protein
MVSPVVRHNDVVLEQAQRWSVSYNVRVQVQPHPGVRPCGTCRHLTGTYTLSALPQTPHAECERDGGCEFVYDLILLA